MYYYYVTVYTLQQHLDSCERHAPVAFAEFRGQVAALRASNDAVLRRLETAALMWRLPGDRPVDDVLAYIQASTDAHYATTATDVTTTRCRNLLATLFSRGTSRPSR